LLSWQFTIKRWVYALYLVAAGGLAGVLAYRFRGPGDLELFAIWQSAVLTAHAIAFGLGTSRKWLISSAAVLALVAFISNAAEMSDNSATNSNTNASTNGSYTTNGNLNGSNMQNSKANTAAVNAANNSKVAAPSPRSPTSSEYFQRGVNCENKKDYDCAVENYTKAIELTFAYNNPKAYLGRADAYYEKGSYDMAVADYNKAIELKPDDAEAYNNRGNVYYVKGNHDQAIADYNKAIQLTPNDKVVYLNRGNSYDKKGNYDQAIADYRKALSIDPDYKKAKDNLESVLKKKDGL
jgi:tetratricopeptide (TPR) repeat protein